ncbi:uncharacterized protein LOC143292069 [Babylonia areolata]|uniref:uncharacterized protein LOC143292069 n=1 Tax=Babylonia areolata TaxID=304850 RepID=UPI003FD123BB
MAPVFLITLLLFGVTSSGAQTCTDYMGAVQCSTDYANGVANMSLAELTNINVFCQKIEELKSCLAQVCGGQDNIPQEFLTSIDTSLQQFNLNCDAVAGETCADYPRTVECSTEFSQHISSGSTPSVNEYCRHVDSYKSCLTEACGGWDRVPETYVHNINTNLEQESLQCGSGNVPVPCLSLFLAICLSVVVVGFHRFDYL